MKFVSPAQDISKLGFFSDSKPEISSIADLVNSCQNCRAGMTTVSQDGTFQTTPVQGYLNNYLYLTKILYTVSAINLVNDVEAIKSLCATVSGGGSSNRSNSYATIDATEKDTPMGNGTTNAMGLVMPIPSSLPTYATDKQAMGFELPQVRSWIQDASIRSGTNFNTTLRSATYKQANVSVSSIILSYVSSDYSKYINGSITGSLKGYQFACLSPYYAKSNTSEYRGGNPVYLENSTIRIPRVWCYGAPNEMPTLDWYFIPVNVDNNNIQILILKRGEDFNLDANSQPAIRANGSQLRKIKTYDNLVLSV